MTRSFKEGSARTWRFTSRALAALFLGSVQTAAAGEHSAETPGCKEITARLIERTNTHFDRFSPSGGSVFFKRPDMVLICDPKFVTYVSINWDASGFPSNDWFALAARAGSAVTGTELKKLETAAHRCHRAALNDKSELASVYLDDATVEC
ncbi:hypothetical protein A5906_30720 [Bradyrhizobium sacchari]|uniref:Secreted protein n=1 Tax=Bradyrhizobium sacchari TaxID=1399419 RepID=A0A560JW47_9BRAD|nr:hypothetical protein [Bradyrhizobium sacchari]OPY98933.1 hypothetical protein A5906_30720 [Bradyrhizobium sacchari]TWB60416.1 hypothetical protein FBZ94_104641 [Bradyrhizobium sacchari]TWB73774.1 hypothetical protein FBZ95_10524 [Bradyrhizobium sacchari]